MTLLVTGGCGYIGSHMVQKLLKEGVRVVVFDNLSKGHKEVIDILKKHGSLEFVEGDLRHEEDLQKVFAKEKIDAVLHFAALCSVDESVKNPELYFENNVKGTQNLLEAMDDTNVKKIIFSSTCAIYGNAEYLPIDEKHPAKPLNPYGESKLQVEKMIEDFGKTHGFHYVILRYFNVCGADSAGEIGDSKKPSQLLVQNAVRGALGIEEFKLTCPTVDTRDGTPIRDYIDVLDIVDAHMKAMQYLENGGENVTLNLGSGSGFSVKEIVEAVKEELGADFPLAQSSETRQGEYKEVYADNKKAREVLDWKPKRSIKESIRNLKTWYEKNPNGYTS